MDGHVTHAELVKRSGASELTVRKIIKHLGIKPKADSYDKRLKLYSDEQVQQVLEITSRIKYTKKEASNG